MKPHIRLHVEQWPNGRVMWYIRSPSGQRMYSAGTRAFFGNPFSTGWDFVRGNCYA